MMFFDKGWKDRPWSSRDGDPLMAGVVLLICLAVFGFSLVGLVAIAVEVFS